MKSSENDQTDADRKLRWGGLLENPLISHCQRNCLDYGRVEGLRRALERYSYQSVLDIGCGLGDHSVVNKKYYFGFDNSFPRVHYASAKHPAYPFFVGDALRIPVKPGAVDLAMLIDTSHHLTDQEFRAGLEEIKRVSRKYIVISDPVLTEDQDAISKVLYSWDRGENFRTIEQMRGVIEEDVDLKIVEVTPFRTFPGFYYHAAFIIEIAGN